MKEPTDTTAMLQGIIDALQAEWTQMQIMGRALTPEER